MTKQLKIILAVIGIILAAIALLFGNNIYQQITRQPPSETVQPTLVSEIPLTDEAIAKNNGCLECHGADQKIGPTFHDIAAKYKGDARARDALIETVKNGGKGNWTEVTGGVPMPPYSPRLSDAEIEQLVDWLSGL